MHLECHLPDGGVVFGGCAAPEFGLRLVEVSDAGVARPCGCPPPEAQVSANRRGAYWLQRIHLTRLVAAAEHRRYQPQLQLDGLPFRRFLPLR
jgi:hypothetical protein